MSLVLTDEKDQWIEILIDKIENQIVWRLILTKHQKKYKTKSLLTDNIENHGLVRSLLKTMKLKKKVGK